MPFCFKADDGRHFSFTPFKLEDYVEEISRDTCVG